MPRSFTDQIWRTLKYMQKLKDTYSSHLMPLQDKNLRILAIAIVGILNLLLLL